MTNTITGANLITINAVAGDDYCIEYESGYNVNILNQTDGVITISLSADHAENETSAECLKLVEDAFYYDLCSRLSKNLYIASDGDGLISVVRTDR